MLLDSSVWIQIVAPPSDVSFIVSWHLALQQSKRSQTKRVLSPLVSHCLPTYVCLCWMACSPSRGLVSPCLRLSPHVCVPIMDGVFAFLRSCLPCLLFSLIVPHMCACVGWCLRLPDVLSPLVSLLASLCWIVCPPSPLSPLVSEKSEWIQEVI